MSETSAERPQSKGSVAKLVFVTLIGMITLQAAAKHFQWTSKWQTPGEARGDLCVEESCVDEQIGAWKRLTFSPPGEVADGQYWWSYSWSFSDSKTSAIVSLDQAAWYGWHELSQCYSSTGWNLQSREVRLFEDDNWQYVLSRFEKPGGQFATLIFSMCHVDGLPIAPWDLNLRESGQHAQSLADLLKERRRHASDRSVSAIQCQVFSPSATKHSEEQMQQLLSLHRHTRRQFRDEAIRLTGGQKPSEN